MAAQRQYETFTLFNMRIVDMRHLWVPSDTYKGQKQQKPNYFGGFIVQKTQAQWSNEPALAGLVQAYGRLYANNPQIVDWRIEDGDTPNAEGKSSDFAKGHWLLNASSSNPINVELVQAGGALVKLQNKVGVKSGDYCMIGGSAAVSAQNNRAVKLYLNAVVFTAPGEEIVFANSVTGAELMQRAQQQGMQVAGFSSAPGFGGQPQQFGQQPFAPQGAPGFTPTSGGFPGTQQNGPQPGPAPFQAPTGAPGPAFGAAPAPGGTFGGAPGNATFPSNPAPQFPAGPQFGQR
jgi:hypothetical protein